MLNVYFLIYESLSSLVNQKTSKPKYSHSKIRKNESPKEKESAIDLEDHHENKGSPFAHRHGKIKLVTTSPPPRARKTPVKNPVPTTIIMTMLVV